MVVAFRAAAIKAALEFEQQMDKLRNIAGALGLDPDVLLEEAKEVAFTTGVSFADAADYVSRRKQDETRSVDFDSLERAWISIVLFDPAYKNSRTSHLMWFGIYMENFKHTFIRDFPLCVLARKIFQWWFRRKKQC